jgi:hypothetical protein
MAIVTPENVFEPRHSQNEDDMSRALCELLQDIAREAFLILNNMQLINGVIAQKTRNYQNQLILNKGISPAKSRGAFIDMLTAIDQYHNHIRKYHELLDTDVCSYLAPLWAYKQLRHHLVIRVLKDIRKVKELADVFSKMRSNRETTDYLMNRWQRELVNFAVLEI